MLLPIIELEPALSTETAKLANEYNDAATVHNANVADFEKRAAALAKPAEDIDADELFKANGLSADRFRLRQAALKIRRDILTPLLLARAADRRAAADAADAAIEPAKDSIVAKLHKLGFTGNGRTYDSQAVGCIFPGQVTAHKTVQTAYAAAQNARSLVGSVYEAQANVEEIQNLQKLIAAIVAAAAA